jgi:VWFA-related protein
VTRQVVLLFLLFDCVFAASGNDPPSITYHRAVSEVRVTFFATDENNHPIERVTKDDFAIVDDDVVVREFRSLTHSNETALDIIILLDASESVSPHFQSSLNEVLQLVSQNQLASENALSVLAFAGMKSTVLCDHSCQDAAVNRKLLAIQAEGATPLFDALLFCANFIASRRIGQVRPVVILLSDGKDTISKVTPSDALHSVVSSGALIYAIDVNSPGSISGGSLTLRRMADATGGRYFSPRESTADVLQAALADLHASYVVTYRPPRPVIGFHSLRILPKRNLNLRFHSRSSYYYGESVP